MSWRTATNTSFLRFVQINVNRLHPFFRLLIYSLRDVTT